MAKYTSLDLAIVRDLEKKLGFSVAEERAKILASRDDPSHRTITLSDGTVLKITPGDFHAIASMNIKIKREVRYGVTNLELKVLDKPSMSLARFLCKPPADAVVTFRNGNDTDYRRSNLLIADKRRKRKKPNATSQYLGVAAYKHRWAARIHVDGRDVWLGYHDREIDAGLAYDRAARRHFGPSARLNFPNEGERSAHE